MQTTELNTKKTTANSINNHAQDQKINTNHAQLNRQSAQSFLQNISKERPKLSEGLQRSLNSLQGNLSKDITISDNELSLSANTQSKDAPYTSLSTKLIDRDKNLQDTAAKILSSADNFVRAKDASLKLKKDFAALPASLKEGSATGNALAKAVTESLAELSSHRTMGAGLIRDLSIRGIYVSAEEPSNIQKNATTRLLASTISFIRDNAKEVLNKLPSFDGNIEERSNNEATFNEASTQDLKNSAFKDTAAQDLKDNNTYLDIFKRNNSSQNESLSLSVEPSERIKQIIARAAEKARRSNLIRTDSSNSPNKSSASDAIDSADKSSSNLRELASRASSLERQFRTERQKLVQDGKLPDPADYPDQKSAQAKAAKNANSSENVMDETLATSNNAKASNIKNLNHAHLKISYNAVQSSFFGGLASVPGMDLPLSDFNNEQLKAFTAVSEAQTLNSKRMISQVISEQQRLMADNAENKDVTANSQNQTPSLKQDLVASASSQDSAIASQNATKDIDKEITQNNTSDSEQNSSLKKNSSAINSIKADANIALDNADVAEDIDEGLKKNINKEALATSNKEPEDKDLNDDLSAKKNASSKSTTAEVSLDNEETQTREEQNLQAKDGEPKALATDPKAQASTEQNEANTQVVNTQENAQIDSEFVITNSQSSAVVDEDATFDDANRNESSSNTASNQVSNIIIEDITVTPPLVQEDTQAIVQDDLTEEALPKNLADTSSNSGKLSQMAVANAKALDESSANKAELDNEDLKQNEEQELNLKNFEGEDKNGNNISVLSSPLPSVASSVTTGGSMPLPEQSKIEPTTVANEGGLFRKIASLFSKASHESTVATPQSIAASEVSLKVPTMNSPFDVYLKSLSVVASDSTFPESLKKEALELKNKLLSPLADLTAADSWLSLVASPMSSSSPRAIAIQQWAFLLLCLRFKQIGKSISGFLKKKDLASLDSALEGLIDKSDENESKLEKLCSETLEQISRLQKREENVHPLLNRALPLPPCYDGGKEGALMIRKAENDKKNVWHLTFQFDLERLGQIEIKAVAAFPEIRISFATETLEGLKAVQNHSVELAETLESLGFEPKASAPRLGRIRSLTGEHEDKESFADPREGISLEI